jgi:hypothetical protein
MGPLAHARRVEAMEGFVADARKRGAELREGGERIGNKGYFFAPTVLTDVPTEARAMNEEPFGPLAVVAPFREFDEVVAEANRLPYGLASYAYTRSAKTAQAIAASVEAGMMSINHHGLALPEVPFGGVKDSGYGSEGGLRYLPVPSWYFRCFRLRRPPIRLCLSRDQRRARGISTHNASRGTAPTSRRTTARRRGGRSSPAAAPPALSVAKNNPQRPHFRVA